MKMNGSDGSQFSQQDKIAQETYVNTVIHEAWELAQQVQVQEICDAPLSEARKLTILRAWEQLVEEEFNESGEEAFNEPPKLIMSLGNSIETDSETQEGKRFKAWDKGAEKYESTCQSPTQIRRKKAALSGRNTTQIDGFYDHTRSDQATAQQQGQKAILSTRKAWFYPGLPWGAPPSWDEGQPRIRCLPHRGKNFLLQWELLNCFACFYVGLKVPYVIVYDSVKLSENRMFQECSLKEFAENSTGAFSFSATVTVVDLVFDTMFFVDIVINFLSARWVISNSGRDFWILVDDMSDIRKLYMWDGLFPSFWIDLLGHDFFKLILRIFSLTLTVTLLISLCSIFFLCFVALLGVLQCTLALSLTLPLTLTRSLSLSLSQTDYIICFTTSPWTPIRSLTHLSLSHTHTHHTTHTP
jgi:hypothetical protein